MPADAPRLQLQSVTRRYGALVVTSELSLSVAPGEAYGVIGPNGAGKSTLFKLISGTYRPDAGQVRFDGVDITPFRPHRRIQQGLSIKFQVPGIFVDLGVEHNLRIALQRCVAPSQMDAETEKLLAFLDLADSRGLPAGNLSHGQQQWLEIGMAIALKPKLLLLDEPTAGMSPEETLKTGELVKRLNAEGMTIVVIEHDMTFVRQIARRVTVLHFGQLFLEGTLDEVVNNEEVVRIYLGKE